MKVKHTPIRKAPLKRRAVLEDCVCGIASNPENGDMRNSFEQLGLCPVDAPPENGDMRNSLSGNEMTPFRVLAQSACGARGATVAFQVASGPKLASILLRVRTLIIET
jgi:hypothetical protein